MAKQTQQPKSAHGFEKYLREAFCENSEQLLRQKKHNTHLHTALLVKRGKILAEATNQVGSRSMGCGFSDCTIHAEKAVVKQLGDFQKLRGADMYVFRVGQTEKSRYSEPCESCANFLKKCMREYGLRFVFYSI